MPSFPTHLPFGERARRLVLLAGPLVLSHILLLVLFDFSRWPILTILLLFVAFAAYFLAACQLEDRLKIGHVLVIAAILRGLLLPLPPTLSDDVLRYVWDGRVLTAGFNPYQLAPEAEELAALRDARWEIMPHKHVPTVYPPVALMVFSIASATPFPILALKLLLVLGDLIGCYVLLRLLGALGRPVGHGAWYAWNPLVTVEIAGMGHIDALVVLSQVATLWFLLRRAEEGERPQAISAAAAAAGGVLAKLVPLVALPIWARFSGRQWTFMAALTIFLTATLLPVVVSTGGVPPGLVMYGVQWEFNGPIYEPLWRLYDVIEISDTVKQGLTGLKNATGRHDFWNRLYPLVYPQFLAKLTLGALFVVLFVVSWRTRDPIAATGRLFGSVLLCSATVYPWYLLWVLPWAALGRHRAWLVAALVSPLAYWPQLTGAAYFPWCYLLIWVPFFILLPRSSWSTA